jgi:hypothetical protein
MKCLIVACIAIMLLPIAAMPPARADSQKVARPTPTSPTLSDAERETIRQEFAKKDATIADLRQQLANARSEIDYLKSEVMQLKGTAGHNVTHSHSPAENTVSIKVEPSARVPAGASAEALTNSLIIAAQHYLRTGRPHAGGILHSDVIGYWRNGESSYDITQTNITKTDSLTTPIIGEVDAPDSYPTTDCFATQNEAESAQFVKTNTLALVIVFAYQADHWVFQNVRYRD